MKTILKSNSFPLSKRIVENQLELLWNFTRSLAYYRAINQDFPRISTNREFWLNTMNTFYLKAVNDWCIVFGADHNESHWKQLPQDNVDFFKKEIRSLILEVTDFSKSEWDLYWEEMVGFRNGYTSHRNVNISENVPGLDKAFEVAQAYFEKIKEMLKPSTNEPKSLESAFPDFQIEIYCVLKREF